MRFLSSALFQIILKDFSSPFIKNLCLRLNESFLTLSNLNYLSETTFSRYAIVSQTFQDGNICKKFEKDVSQAKKF